MHYERMKPSQQPKAAAVRYAVEREKKNCRERKTDRSNPESDTAEERRCHQTARAQTSEFNHGLSLMNTDSGAVPRLIRAFRGMGFPAHDSWTEKSMPPNRAG
jgi:hypothetical protein